MNSILRRLGIVLSIATVAPSLVVACSSGETTKTAASPTPFQTISENVTWQIADTTMAATITRPDDKKAHPAVVFVAGSGPTDRDWNSPLLPGTNGSARLLAEELAKDGFVTIRYDKRFTGPYAQENMPKLAGKISLESHLDELQGAVDQLVARSDVDAKKIFVLGNSEGTIHALNYQLTRQPKFAGLILTGVPGRSLADVTRGQIAAQVASLPNANDIMARYDKAMADFLAGKPFVADPNQLEGINTFFQGLYAPINMPFTREFFGINSAPWLAKVKEPVLAMIGKKDIQVDYILDGGPLEAVAKGMSNVTFSYPDNANHVLKNETRPREALTSADGLTYNASDRILDADALRTIKDWLDQRAK